MLEYSKYTISFVVLEESKLPSYKGSTFRGSFGSALKNVICSQRKKECNECILNDICIYPRVFEPVGFDKKQSKVTSIPRPFIIEPESDMEREYKPGDIIKFNLILIGPAIQYFPYFILAFKIMGEKGFGYKRTKCHLSNIYSTTDSKSTLIYDHVEDQIKSQPLKEKYSIGNSKSLNDVSMVSFDFQTPLRLKHNGRYVSKLTFEILIVNMIRRIEELSRYYGHNSINQDTIKSDLNYLIDGSRYIKIKNDELVWYDWERYSNKQNTKLKLGGLTGKIEFEGDLGEYIDLLKFGEILHVGKATAFGLGKYSMVIK